MVLIEFRCLTCAHVFNASNPPFDRTNPPACTACGAASERWYPPPTTRWSVDPVVVYRSPDGSFRFPGDATGAGAARYAQLGYERVELRGAADVRRFESAMNKHEYSRAMRRCEAAQAAREQRESINRSALRQQMSSMSRRGRDLARSAMAINDAKPREYAKESGFHSEVYSNDRSNRDDSRDAQGRRRRD